MHQNSIAPFHRKTEPQPGRPLRFARRLCFGRGLYLLQMPNGSEYWRLRYRMYGKDTTMALGVSPYVSIGMARVMQRVARRLLALGMDPVRYKHVARQAARPLALAG